MMPKRMTHEGVYRGCDARSNSAKRWRCLLRETSKYWVTSNHLKFCKDDGRGTGNWPMYKLDLNSVKPRRLETWKDIQPGDPIHFFDKGMQDTPADPATGVQACKGWKSKVLKGIAHSTLPTSETPLGTVWMIQWQGCSLPVGEEDFRGFVK